MFKKEEEINPLFKRREKKPVFYKNWKLDYNKLFITLIVLLLIISNFYLLNLMHKNIKTIGQLNFIIIQQNELIIKEIKHQWI